LCIHPVAMHPPKNANGKYYKDSDGKWASGPNATDGCIRLAGPKNAVPFLKMMRLYFTNHSSILLTVKVENNNNVITKKFYAN